MFGEEHISSPEVIHNYRRAGPRYFVGLSETTSPRTQSPNPEVADPRLSDRDCLTGIVLVLRSGVPWQMLPRELGCGSGMTC